MNIWYIIIPVIIILTILGSYSLLYAPIGQCPICDDENSCTMDWCNSTSGYECTYTKLSGEQTDCIGDTELCGYNSCDEGICTIFNRTYCCGNGICESNENCTSCFRDCGSCPQINLKNEYQLGETINASASFNQKIYVGPDAWSVYEFLNESENFEPWEAWNPLDIYKEWNFCYLNKTQCGLNPPMPTIPIYQGCREIDPGEISTWSWNQKFYESKSILCENVVTNKTVSWMCDNEELATPGRYLVRFQYTTDCPVQDRWGENTTIKYVEREFVINNLSYTACGDGVCDSNENYTNCCVDCSCPSSQSCENDTCCLGEGNLRVVYPSGPECCLGLSCVSNWQPNATGECDSLDIKLGACICTNCGNHICGLGENKCNCPEDCESGGSQINMKDKYQQGEIINASVSFSQKIYTGLNSWSFFKYKNSAWEPFSYFQYSGSGYFFDCTENLTNCGMNYPPVYLADAPPYLGCRELNATQISTFSYDQSIYKTHTIQCPHYETYELINWTCVYSELMEKGRYKLRFSYTTDCPVPNYWGQNTTIEYLEREFSIV